MAGVIKKGNLNIDTKGELHGRMNGVIKQELLVTWRWSRDYVGQRVPDIGTESVKG